MNGIKVVKTIKLDNRKVSTSYVVFNKYNLLEFPNQKRE